MDKASLTIDRHTPIIPESLWCGMDPTTEKIFTKTKNRVILPSSRIEQITRWKNVKGNRYPNEEKRKITEEMLEKAQFAISASECLFDGHIMAYLEDRGVTEDEIKKWRMCQTSELLEFLDGHYIDNLTLRIPAKFNKYVRNREIDGISIPYYRDNKLCGFVTRVLGEHQLKYAVTVPNRLCFGTDFEQKEVYVVEGVFDAIAASSIGLNPLGMSDSQPNYYKMWTANRFEIINLAFDPDYAGWLGVLKAYVILTTMLGRNPETINILELEDEPERLIRDSGKLLSRKITFKEAIERADALGKVVNIEDMVL